MLGQGMGLGLTITRNLLENYGAFIKFVQPTNLFRDRGRNRLAKQEFVLNMMKIEKPSILVIDDESDNLGSQIDLGLADRATASAIHPRDVEMSDLKNADLVLVDYRLDSWPERDAQSVSLNPATGMALAVVLREQVDRSQEGKLDGICAAHGSSRRNPGTVFICDRPACSRASEQP